jgi:hypothetical protein
MNDDKALEDFPLCPEPVTITEALRLPNGLPDPEPLRRATGLLRVASAALAQRPAAALDANAHHLRKLVCACQELITEWLEACGSTESRKHWLVWDALDVLELIDMAIEADRPGSLEKTCYCAADLLERLVRDCETAPSIGEPAARPETPPDTREPASERRL